MGKKLSICSENWQTCARICTFPRAEWALEGSAGHMQLTCASQPLCLFSSQERPQSRMLDWTSCLVVFISGMWPVARLTAMESSPAEASGPESYALQQLGQLDSSSSRIAKEVADGLPVLTRQIHCQRCRPFTSVAWNVALSTLLEAGETTIF